MRGEEEEELRKSLIDRYKKPRLAVTPSPQSPPHEAPRHASPPAPTCAKSPSPQRSPPPIPPMPDVFRSLAPTINTGSPEYDNILKNGDRAGQAVNEINDLIVYLPLDVVGRTRACVWAAQTRNILIIRALSDGITWQSILDLTPDLHPHTVLFRLFASTISYPHCFNELVIYAKIPLHEMVAANSKLAFAMYREALDIVLADPAPLRNLNSYILPFVSHKYVLNQVLDRIAPRTPNKNKALCKGPDENLK